LVIWLFILNIFTEFSFKYIKHIYLIATYIIKFPTKEKSFKYKKRHSINSLNITIFETHFKQNPTIKTRFVRKGEF